MEVSFYPLEVPDCPCCDKLGMMSQVFVFIPDLNTSLRPN